MPVLPLALTVPRRPKPAESAVPDRACSVGKPDNHFIPQKKKQRLDRRGRGAAAEAQRGVPQV